MPTTEPFNMAEFGLITDVPSNSTALTAWSDSLNIRAKDSSVQGVYKFGDSFEITKQDGESIDAKPIAITQWTPAGTDFLKIAYIVESTDSGDTDKKGRVFTYTTDPNKNITTATVEITNATSGAAFTIDPEYPPQIFVFNELLIVNPGTGTPQYITADETTNGNLDDLPGFETLAQGSYPRVMRAYKNRLVAMNWFDDKNTSSTTDDTYQPIDFVWSSNITGIGSLPTASWQASTTNTAGDAFLTATPGKILDGFQLGDDFIVTKEDSLVRVYETGDALILGFDSLLEDDGAYSHNCVANIGNSQQFVFGNYGVYIHDGRGDKQDIAKGVFQEDLYASVNSNHKDRSFVFLQTRDKEVWICFSSKTNTGEGCDMAYVYDYNTSKLHKRSLPNVTDIYETEIGGELKIYATSPATKQIQELSTSTFESDGFFLIEDKDVGGSDKTKDVTSLLINSENNIKVSLQGTYNIKDAKSYLINNPFNPSTNYKIDVRVNGRYLNLRVSMDGATNPKLTTMAFDIKVTGNR